MASEQDPHLDNLIVFSKDDFEDNWEKVGSGGFGHIFKVKHKLWRTVYAVKCCPSILMDSSLHSSSAKSLIDEAAKMEKIKFRYIVPIYGICDNHLGIVMEYMENGSLEKLLHTHSISWQLKFRIIHEISLGMNFLHCMKPPLLHLDLKPGNILLDDHLHVKISDFGLSKWMEHSTRMEYIERSAIRGTLSYIPPEMFLQNTRVPSTKHDVYSFGIVIWEILTQKKPYSGASMMTIIIKVAAGNRPLLEDITEERPSECQQMIDLMQRCWSQDPKKRPRFQDIPIETDMLLYLLTSPMSEALGARENEPEPLNRKESSRISAAGSTQSVENPLNFCETTNDIKDMLKEFLQSQGSNLDSFESVMTPQKVSEVYENNLTLLHFTVAQGNIEKVKFVLKQGVNVNSQTVSGHTALTLAVQNKFPEICSILIKHGASVNLPDEDNWSPLHFAAQIGDDRIVRLLLDHQADVDAREHDGWTPLHLASQNGFENVVRVLLTRHSDPNSQENDGKTPLHVASYFNHYNLVKLLISQGAHLDSRQKNGRTPLHIAASRGYFRVIHQLVKMGATVTCCDQNYYSPLHMAALKGNSLICKHLIKHQANVNLKTSQGWTPLHLAVYKGHMEIIKLLKDSYANLNAKGDMDWTPLHVSVRYTDEMVVSELLSAEADPNVAEASGWTPLHLAVQQSSFCSIINLIEHKADVNARNKSGWTPLHLAVLNNNSSVIKTLLRAHARLDIEDTCGCTPLQLAIRNQKDSIVSLLEGNDLSFSSTEEEGEVQTPGHGSL
ncbi:ankyrin repeat and protein kinase domain-containing protein 1 [Microcaecilia unicolor]|uniref:Ankyrin repeat and protein kinase domain-containing protein 1 n=1 Tax=Microcaecilia unicolor TaxID=1415580 RepID=A0A6P7ZEL3_9AMPH|nr:ankyrin repeat and protein kinase domain-containing protein 1 [Microcaecilia unicolor]